MLAGLNRDVIGAMHTADGRGAPPAANQPTYISLDCVSGRLLDKDHNMTLFLFCAGSVNSGKAPAAQHAPVQGIDHTSQT